MKFPTTIKRKIFAFNVFTVVLLILIIAVAFNISARIYMERETLNQLRNVARRAEGSLFGMKNENFSPLIGSYISLVRASRQPHFMSNTEIAFIDKDRNLLIPKELKDVPFESDKQIISYILDLCEKKQYNEMTFQYNGVQYAAVVIRAGNRYANLSNIVFYTRMDRIAELQRTINLILLIVLFFAALIATMFSSYLSKKISTPLSKLCSHIRNISERQFNRIQIPADDEILELVDNINIMTEKLESYDLAQKTFLQNVSHELRTPIMSIRSYAEGIRYGVVESGEAVKIIIDETQRLTKLVENLLYLSRLDSIDEPYNFEILDFHELLHYIAMRMKGIAQKSGKEISTEIEPESVKLSGDEEKLTRAITNILDNSIRYAAKKVVIKSRIAARDRIELTISDDGPGFDTEDLKNLFTRFYKGKKGHFGLGLSITKSIIDKHSGTITAGNTSDGAYIKITLPMAG